MCGRYSLTTPVDALRDLFGFDARPNLAPRYNIAPTQEVAVVRLASEAGGRQLAMLRWGLIPSWAKDPSIGSRMINARAETVAEKPAFRTAFRRRRCLVLADGSYEWKTSGDGPKQPWRITCADAAAFAFAGLWEHWDSPDGETLESCTIVTTEAAPAISHIHPRMPVILAPGERESWLSGDPADAGGLLHPYDGTLEAYPVSRRVNNVRNDDDALIEPVSAEDASDLPEKPAQGTLF
jgi:putative SOS response-associated peptidase YedK